MKERILSKLFPQFACLTKILSEVVGEEYKGVCEEHEATPSIDEEYNGVCEEHEATPSILYILLIIIIIFGQDILLIIY